MAVLKDIVEQNRKVALSVVNEFGYEVEVNSEDERVVLVVGIDYLNTNFKYLFFDNFYYNSEDAVDYDDINALAYDHVNYVLDDLYELDNGLYDLVKAVNNNVDYVREFEGCDLTAVVEVDLGSNAEDRLIDRLVEEEFVG